jgi:hypothetical protein
MIRIKIPAIRAIKGDNEMPAMKASAITIGQSPRWMVQCFIRRLLKEARHVWSRTKNR